MAAALKADAMALVGVEGAGLEDTRKVATRGFATIEDITKAATTVKQIDWGGFYFFRTLAEAQNLDRALAVDGLIMQALASLHAVDGGYYYVYSGVPDCVEAVSSFGNVESISEVPIDKLGLPS